MKESQIEVWNLIGELVKNFRKELDERLASAGLKLVEFKILRLAEREELRMNQIADELGITKSGITFLTDALENRGLIKRCRDSDDRRRFMLKLTPKGKEALRKGNRIYSSYMNKKMRVLDDDEIEQFRTVTLKLLGKEEIYVTAEKIR
jgi:DNA-binding MarR family transcriptional regulator